MEDLVQFLRDRLDEDEKVATACAGDGHWKASDIAIYGQDLAPEVRDHMARHDPAHVLADIEAKRKLLIVHRPVRRIDFTTSDGSLAGPLVVCHECDANTTDADWPDSPCLTLRYLALPYADHPDYNKAWRP